ncbi:response regulator [Marinimicrobium alkaliphilum]|uniref:response regulator n=1 Tax=Marinimicrobium alkaliphilum TaxID=2202654 RepID=UPI000DBA6FA8|nr:response regulator [Marinimicrobium alkaliphilum]
MSHILIVEDEQKLAQVLEQYLIREGYAVQCCYRGDSALDWLARNSTDLILLDLMLPGVDGLSLCRELRKTRTTPVIMTTARVEEIDRLLGLELGADDYICKPYSPREVVARVRAVLRRTQSLPEPENSEALRLEPDSNRVHLADASVELTAIEMRLLDTLIQRPGRIYSRDQLMDVVYPDQRVVSDRTIDSHIKNLRKKLQQLAPQQEFVRSVYGAGYKYEG